MIALPTDKNFEKLYDLLGLRDFFTYVTSSDLQNLILPIKIVFILFTLFFLGAVIYFYMNSSYLKYQSLQDMSELLSWQAYGLQEATRRLKSIRKRVVGGSEREYKLAVLESDDFLNMILEDSDFKGATFEAKIESAGKRIMPNWKEILAAHQIRNLIAHDVNYKLDIDVARKLLDEYQTAIMSTYSV